MDIFSLNQENNNIQCNILDCFFDLGLSKGSFIHIYGQEDVGKTVLALEIANKNIDKTFLYIDTYFNINKTPSNVYLYRTNKISAIKEFINLIEKNNLDFLIIDTMSNLLLENENQTYYSNDNRYEIFNKEFIELLMLCVKKNITIIAINSLNGYEQPAYFSLQIKKLCQLNILLEQISFDNKILTIKLIPKKNKIAPILKEKIIDINIEGDKYEL